MSQNADDPARYAKICQVDGCSKESQIFPCLFNIHEFSKTQAAGMVPIVEPEILIDGNHTIQRFQEVSL